MDFRNTALSTLAVAISVLLVFSFTAAASGQLLGMDERIEAYSRSIIWLSKQDDLDPEEDFYELSMSVASQVEDAWSGPITVNFYVFLPSDASSIYASEGTLFNVHQPLLQPQDLHFEPEIEGTGSFVRVYWRLSSERFGVARAWSFSDREDYSVSFVVPQNASVTVYAYVQVASYTYQGVCYSQLADERMYWLEVGNTDETTTLPQAVETGAPILIFDTSGINSIIAAVFSAVAFWHFKRYRQRLLKKTGVNEQGMSKADYSARHPRTLGITILAAVVGALGILSIITGSFQLIFDASFAVSLLAAGLASALIAVGLCWVKPWAWYAAVGFMIIGIIDYFLLFTTLTTLTIPFDPFILIYLIAIRHRFF